MALRFSTSRTCDLNLTDLDDRHFERAADARPHHQDSPSNARRLRGHGHCHGRRQWVIERRREAESTQCRAQWRQRRRPGGDRVGSRSSRSGLEGANTERGKRDEGYETADHQDDFVRVPVWRGRSSRAADRSRTGVGDGADRHHSLGALEGRRRRGPGAIGGAGFTLAARLHLRLEALQTARPRCGVARPDVLQQRRPSA